MCVCVCGVCGCVGVTEHCVSGNVRLVFAMLFKTLVCEGARLQHLVFLPSPSCLLVFLGAWVLDLRCAVFC